MIFPKPLPPEGFPIAVRASFTVFKRFPLLAIASNNLAPRLILFEDGLEHRVITTQRHLYANIEQIDARQSFATHSIIFHWRDGPFAFSANVGAVESQLSLLIFFAGRHVPLSARARKIMQESRS
jgi:hypothetical protein